MAWTVGGNIAQTIFDGGTLLFRQKVAEETYRQAEAEYRNTVITAFQNVTDSLRALQSDARAVSASLRAENTAKRFLDLVREQAKLGQVAPLVILNAQQTYLQAVINRVQAQAAQLSDTAALFMALGGGWWNQPPEPVVQQAAATKKDGLSFSHDTLAPRLSLADPYRRSPRIFPANECRRARSARRDCAPACGRAAASCRYRRR